MPMSTGMLFALRQFLLRSATAPGLVHIVGPPDKHPDISQRAVRVGIRSALWRAEHDAEQMAIVTRAIDRMLEQHEPHPALVLDRYWNVIRTNEAAPRFFGSFVDLDARPKPRNLLDLMFDPSGMRPFVEEWENVAAGLLQRVLREAVGQVESGSRVARMPTLSTMRLSRRWGTRIFKWLDVGHLPLEGTNASLLREVRSNEYRRSPPHA
jgi:hypothetical protein